MVDYPFAILVFLYVSSFSYLYLRCHDRLPLRKYLSNQSSSSHRSWTKDRGFSAKLCLWAAKARE